MKPYLVFGAGAVGSAISAYLARQGHQIRLVARRSHVEAILAQGGLRVVSREETFTAAVLASVDPPPALDPETVIFLTVQSPEVGDALEALAPHLRHPVVTWQNGIRAEEIAAPRCPVLFGGVVRFTATLLDPGEVRLRSPGKLILGRHPEGEDVLASEIADDLSAAGFETAVSSDIGADKALKLLVNLVSGPPVLLKRTGKEPALAAVQVAILEEAIAVFEAAGIAAHPASGIGQTVEELVAHFQAGGSAPDTTGKIYNSTWQNLHHRRPRIENDYYHGEIVRIGARHGVNAPVNARALEVLEEVRREELGPEPFDLATFRECFANVVDLEELPPARASDAEGALEI
jgi:2-dehydropantoate 2-reductase